MRGLIRLIIIALAIKQTFFFWKRKIREPQRILIAHHLLLGDTLLLAPLMKRINEKYPHAKKFILVKPSFISLFEMNPYGFQSLSFSPKSFSDFWNIYRNGDYDLTFVMGDNRFSWLARAVGSRWNVGIEGDRPLWKNWMLDEAKSFDLKPATWADMMGRLVDGNNPVPYKKNEWPSPKLKEFLLPFDSSRKYIICHLGASNELRYWPCSSWQLLLRNIKLHGFDVVLSVGPGEEHLIQEVDPENLYTHRSEIYPLIEIWKLLEKATALISLDTGIAHLAKIAFVPTIVLYGPGSSIVHGPGNFWIDLPYKSVTQSPYSCRDQNIFFRRKVLWEKRCSRSLDQCKTPGACMNIIAPEQVMSELVELLGVQVQPFFHQN